MEVEQQETEQKISLQVPNKEGKRVRVIVHDEQRPRPKPAPRQHISFRFTATHVRTGQMALLPANWSQLTTQEQTAVAFGKSATVINIADFYEVLRTQGGLSDQLPLRMAWISDGPPSVLSFDFNAPGYHGENTWPFEWDGRRCELVLGPEYYHILVYQCTLEQAVRCLDSLIRAMPLQKPAERSEKELLVSVPVHQPLQHCYAWKSLSSRNRRSLDTLYLPQQQKHDLVRSLERFRASQSLYDQYGVTWKFCMLFSGPPGCGKTSTVLALCSHFGWNLGKLTLEPRFTGQDLEQMLQKLPEGNALLLEDVDALFAGRQAQSGVDCSTILNLLDGVATRRGLVIFMTTNYPELLDGALKRDGRVDRHFCFAEPGLEEKRQLVARMSGGRWDEEECERLLAAYPDWSMAALQQHMFECIKDDRETLTAQ